MKRPMVYWGILFLLGEMLGQMFQIKLLIAILVGIVSVWLVMYITCKKSKDLLTHMFFGGEKHKWMPCLGLCFLMIGCLNVFLMNQKIQFCESMLEKEIDVKGIIIKCTEQERRITYIVRTSQFNQKRYVIDTVVTTTENTLLPGDGIEIVGKATSFSCATNPGAYDEKSYQYGLGRYLKIEDGKVIHLRRKKFSVRGMLYKISGAISNVYEMVMREKWSSLACAMVLGNKENLDSEIKDLFQKNGIAHIIAISGLHIALIGGSLYQVLRRGTGSYGIAAGIGGTFILLYGWMTGLSSATFRAVIMLLVLIGADLSGRKYDALSAVSLSLLMMLARNPYQVRQVGFLLSFGAILGIVWLVPIGKMYFEKMPKWISALLVSISVQIMTVPIMLWFFYEVPVWSTVLNLFVIPSMSVLLISLIVCGTMGILHLTIAQVMAYPISYIFQFYEYLCEISEQMPFRSMCMGRPSVIFMLGYYGILSFVISTQYLKKRTMSWKRNMLLAGAIFLGGILVMQNYHSKLTICMFDVGQGDGIYMRTPENIHMMMDGGSSSKKKIGKYILKSGVKYFGAGRLDYVFVSHSDQDHYVGIMELLESEEVEIKHLILPAIQNPDEAYHQLEQLAKKRQVAMIYMKEGDMLRVGNVYIRCLNPQETVYPDKNTGSLVLHLQYKKFDMLLTGDMDYQVEERLLKKGAIADGEIEVLKVAHHGSATASSEDFLKQIKPNIALISVGAANHYGHPAKEVLLRLKKYAKQIYMTKDKGAITIETDGNQYKVHTFVN